MTLAAIKDVVYELSNKRLQTIITREEILPAYPTRVKRANTTTHLISNSL